MDDASDEKPAGPSANVANDAGVSADARTWAMFAHLSGIGAGLLTASGFALSFLGPLIIWLIKKEEDEFVADQALEALNFTLTLLIGYAIIYAVALGSCLLLWPVAVLAPVLWVLQIVFQVIAAIRANEGQRYRYPYNVRMIK